MVDAEIGRLLMSSLHQGIGDAAPGRLAFYENWLSPSGLRDGRMGLASLGAVLSFVHNEGAPLNETIARRAGACAAEWTFADLSAWRRRLIARLPVWLRIRAGLAIGRRLARTTVRGSRMRVRIRRGAADVKIRSMVFDRLREPASIPMRAFYAAALARMLTLCAVDARARVHTDSVSGWRIEVTVAGPLPAEGDAG